MALVDIAFIPYNLIFCNLLYKLGAFPFKTHINLFKIQIQRQAYGYIFDVGAMGLVL